MQNHPELPRLDLDGGVPRLFAAAVLLAQAGGERAAVPQGPLLRPYQHPDPPLSAIIEFQERRMSKAFGPFSTVGRTLEFQECRQHLFEMRCIRRQGNCSGKPRPALSRRDSATTATADAEASPAAGSDGCVDWAEDIAALLVMLMPGQEEGNAAAAILFGEANPSARLPLTFPSRRNEVNMSKQMYPGVIDPADGVLKAQYSEKLEVSPYNVL